MAKDDPFLQALLVDQDAVDTQLLSSALTGRIGIGAKDGGIVLGERFGIGTNDDRVLLVLLGRLAAAIMEVQPDEHLSVKELVDISGLPRGSVAPSVRRLLDARLVAQAGDKRYSVPRSKVRQAVEVVNASAKH